MGKKSKNQKPISPQDQHILLQRITELTTRVRLLEKAILKLNEKPRARLILKAKKRMWRICEILSVFSSLLIPVGAFYLGLSNFISIPPTHSLRPDDPLSVPLVITNNSFLALHAIDMEMSALDVEGDTKFTKNISIRKTTKLYKFIKTLRPNKSETIMFSPRFLGHDNNLISIKKADIQISISYKVLFIPKTYIESFRFVAKDTVSGIYEYYP